MLTPEQYPVVREWDGRHCVRVRAGRDTEAILTEVCRALGVRYIDWRFVAERGRRSGNLQILMQSERGMLQWLPVYVRHRTAGVWTVCLTNPEETDNAKDEYEQGH